VRDVLHRDEIAVVVADETDGDAAPPTSAENLLRVDPGPLEEPAADVAVTCKARVRSESGPAKASY
jgi:hypothetical protein